MSKRLSVLWVLLAVGVTACGKIEPPISVATRESLVGQGIVLEVTNTSSDYLHEVTVDITSPSGEKKQYYQTTLKPHESVNVGWLKLDGWPIPEGSEVSVSCKGYALSAGPWTM